MVRFANGPLRSTPMITSRRPSALAKSKPYMLSSALLTIEADESTDAIAVTRISIAKRKANQSHKQNHADDTE